MWEISQTEHSVLCHTGDLPWRFQGADVSLAVSRLRFMWGSVVLRYTENKDTGPHLGRIWLLQKRRYIPSYLQISEWWGDFV